MPTMSLLSLIGASTQAATLVVGEDAPGKVQLASNGDTAFATIMAAMEQQSMTTEQLQAFFLTKGAVVKSLGLQADANGGAQNASVADGQKMPAALLASVQQVTPAPVGASQQVIDVVSKLLQGANSLSDSAKQALVAQLPERELTPEELSAIVQKTGASAEDVFAVLQNTPAVSPILAAAMVESSDATDAAKDGTSAKKLLSMLAKEDEEKKETDKDKQEAVDANAVLAVASLLAAPVQTSAATKAVALSTETGSQDGESVIQTASASTAGIGSALSQQQDAAGVNGKKASKTLAVTADSSGTSEQKTGEGTGLQKAGQSLEKMLSALPVANSVENADSAENVSLTTQFSVAGVNSTSANNAAGGVNLVQFGNQDKMTANTDTITKAGTTKLPENLTEQVLVQVRKNVKEGDSKIEIRLQPEELGRVSVKIETAHDGASKVTVTADRRDTLDMLQRDARMLEKALHDSGMKTESGSLSFNLRGDNQQQSQQHAARQQQSFDTATGGQGDSSGQQQHETSQQYTFNNDDLEERLLNSEMTLSYAVGSVYRMGNASGLDIRA